MGLAESDEQVQVQARVDREYLVVPFGLITQLRLRHLADSESQI